MYFSFVAREEPERPLAMELASARSLLEPSNPERAEADALGLSVLLSSEELLILLRIEDLIDLEELSLVSDLEMDGYCWRVSGRFWEEELFRGVLVPSLLFDCCWPIEDAACVTAGRQGVETGQGAREAGQGGLRKEISSGFEECVLAIYSGGPRDRAVRVDRLGGR